MAELTKKEKAFCLEYIFSGNVEEAERFSKLEGKGKALLCRADICSELERLAKVHGKCLELTARAGLRRLALGGIADAVRLIYMDNPSRAELESLDLFNVAEIRRKDNSTEIKFFDRFKALEKLSEGSFREEKTTPFYDALMKSAESLVDERYGD